MAYSSVEIPNTILVLGSGVFGLSAAHALANRPTYKRTKIILVSQCFPNSTSNRHTSTDQTASIDNTRIIRADYADPLYSRLAREAQTKWRGEWGADGRYRENGLLITADEGGESYVRMAMANVKATEQGEGLEHPILELPSPKEIAAAMKSTDGTAVGSGNTGYVNPHSGWADAGAAMRWFQKTVESEGRVEFRTGEVTRLRTERDASSGRVIVTGADLADGSTVSGELIILATGAWTPKFLDLRGIASARGECMEYVTVSSKEAATLKNLPVHLNMAPGCFFFPPIENGKGEHEIKVARHAYGYTNPVLCKDALNNDPKFAGDTTKTHDVRASLPTFPDKIPSNDRIVLSDFLGKSLPSLNLSHTNNDRQIRTRMCWYLDTPTSDFLICYHPSYNNSLFLATGGSGHAYKFLPVLGDKIVDVLEGKDDKEGMLWTEKWRWRGRTQDDDEVWCDDGSRGGIKGQVLEEALRA